MATSTTTRAGLLALLALAPVALGLRGAAAPLPLRRAPLRPRGAPSLGPPAAAAAASVAALTFTDRMIAGSIARTAAQTVLHPLDTLRTRAQAKKRGDVPSDEPEPPLPLLLLRGIVPQVLLAAPAGALQFAALEAARTYFGARLPSKVACNLLAGAAGALAASVVRVPQENLKQPVQAGRYPSGLAALRALLPEGPARFYRGFSSTVLRDVPWNALSFTIYRALAALAAAVLGFSGGAADAVFGLAGGAIAAVVLTPFDVAKTRLMTQPTPAPGEALQYEGTFGTIGKVAREEGPRALMAGVLPRVLYLAPLASVVFAVYARVIAALLAAKGLA